MRWGHDRVVDMAVAGFRRRALPAAVAYMPLQYQNAVVPER
jgi:hypothetical protein